MSKDLTLKINGQTYELTIGDRMGQVPETETLLETLRDRLGLTGTKMSCGEGACGCCAVLMDGKAVASCITLTSGCEGKEIVLLQFLKGVLPDPAALGPRTVGKTNNGCILRGKKDGKDKTYYLYNVCDHQECYKEVGSQAISYTTGVPAMIGAMMVMKGIWKEAGVYNLEELDPDPFMEALNRYGLPWVVDEKPTLVE